jgi:conjugative relaxase-like TrwC/TraI family protein
VLSIGRLGSDPDPAAYYLEVVASGAEDYYLSAEEMPGRWTGKGAAELGLAGAVAPEDLRAVLEGAEPRTLQKLVGWRKRPGYDLTLSAPKSVSLLWGLGDRATAAAVPTAHEEAVDAAVAYLEDAACVVRRGRGGRVRHPGVGLVGAAFRHRTSRAGDPNLHSHVVVADMTQDPDREWSALFSRAVFRHGRTAGFIYQAVLRHGLATELGVGFGDAKRGVREVEGISAPVRRAFSQRRVAIERAMAEHGARSKHGAQVATLETRPDKQPGVSEATLRRS